MSRSLKETIDDFGVFALLIAFLIGVPIYAIKKHIIGEQAVVLFENSSIITILGFVLFLLAAYIALNNIYLTIIRPRAFKNKYGSIENYQNISPIPIVGSYLLLLSIVLLPNNLFVGVICLALFVLDTGGAPWAAVTIFRTIIRKK